MEHIFLRCDKICKGVRLNIQGIGMLDDLFVLDLAGANLVLGIRWFKSVGKVLSDYTDMAI